MGWCMGDADQIMDILLCPGFKLRVTIADIFKDILTAYHKIYTS
jgi:hypothetical protein